MNFTVIKAKASLVIIAFSGRIQLKISKKLVISDYLVILL